MSYLARELKHRIQILQGEDTPNDLGGFTRSYTQLLRLWASKRRIDKSGFIQAIRGINATKTGNAVDTDEFKVRWASLISRYSAGSQGLGRQFDDAFGNGLDNNTDIYPAKADYFVFLEEGSRTKGRLYGINKVLRDDRNKEFALLRCYEKEEHGTGFPE